jgi:beta-glucosidase
MGYRWYDTRAIEPRYPFGHGLSYTTFELGAPAVSTTTFRDGDTVEVQVAVTNRGGRRGAEVVQCYVHDAEAAVERPEQELKAFAKVALEPGESQSVTLPLDRRAFAFWDPVAEGWAVEPGEFEVRIGTSSRAIAQVVTLRCE